MLLSGLCWANWLSHKLVIIKKIASVLVRSWGCSSIQGGLIMETNIRSRRLYLDYTMISVNENARTLCDSEYHCQIQSKQCTNNNNVNVIREWRLSYETDGHWCENVSVIFEEKTFIKLSDTKPLSVLGLVDKHRGQHFLVLVFSTDDAPD